MGGYEDDLLDIIACLLFQLFEFLAECLGTFLDGIDCVDEYFPLGFSFPFCCQHISLNQVSAVLVLLYGRSERLCSS